VVTAREPRVPERERGDALAAADDFFFFLLLDPDAGAAAAPAFELRRRRVVAEEGEASGAGAPSSAAAAAVSAAREEPERRDMEEREGAKDSLFEFECAFTFSQHTQAQTDWAPRSTVSGGVHAAHPIGEAGRTAQARSSAAANTGRTHQRAEQPLPSCILALRPLPSLLLPLVCVPLSLVAASRQFFPSPTVQRRAVSPTGATRCRQTEIQREQSMAHNNMQPRPPHKKRNGGSSSSRSMVRLSKKHTEKTGK
jgi:hypothetical protein